MKIASIVGARPQFIKLAPIDRAIRTRFSHMIIHTGQHYDERLSETIFSELNIPEPHLNLEIGSGAHAQQTAEMLSRLGEVFAQEQPDIVLVYGDTNSTLAGALAAVKLHIPVAHVEAGYRSHDLSMPEEVNRVMTDRISQILLAPTEDAVENLMREGAEAKRVFFVGNIMAESLLGNLPRSEKSSVLEALGLTPGGYGVLTVHRPENTNDSARLARIMRGLAGADFPIIFPVHPRTSKFLAEMPGGADKTDGTVKYVSPMGYIDFLRLQSQAKIIITDSGGMQEEALLLGVPCLTLRYNTERVMTLQLGVNKLVGTDPDLISRSLAQQETVSSWPKPAKWDNKVAERILNVLDNNNDLLEIKPEVVRLS